MAVVAIFFVAFRRRRKRTSHRVTQPLRLPAFVSLCFSAFIFTYTFFFSFCSSLECRYPILVSLFSTPKGAHFIYFHHFLCVFFLLCQFFLAFSAKIRFHFIFFQFNKPPDFFVCPSVSVIQYTVSRSFLFIIFFSLSLCVSLRGSNTLSNFHPPPPISRYSEKRKKSEKWKSHRLV